MKRCLSVAAGLLACFSTSGCAFVGDKVDTDSVTYFVQQYLVGNSSIVETDLDTSKLGDVDLDLLSSYGKSCSVTVEYSESDGYGVTISYPDLSIISGIAKEDSNGFVRGYSELLLDNATEEVKEQFVKEYFSSVLKAGSVPADETVSIPVTVTDSSILDKSSGLGSLQESVITFDYLSVIDGIALEGGVSEDRPVLGEFTTITKDESFVFEEGGVKFLVHDINIVSGQEAIDAVNSLSVANNLRDYKDSDCAVYMTYSIKNLSVSEAIAHNNFKLVNSNNVVVKQINSISGLQSVSSISAGEDAGFSCFLVGPKDCSIYWYADGVNGSYLLSVLL